MRSENYIAGVPRPRLMQHLCSSGSFCACLLLRAPCYRQAAGEAEVVALYKQVGLDQNRIKIGSCHLPPSCHCMYDLIERNL